MSKTYICQKKRRQSHRVINLNSRAMSMFGLILKKKKQKTSSSTRMAYGLGPIIVCSNGDPGVTLTYFTAWSNLVT